MVRYRGLSEKAERRHRRVSGAVLIWDNRETQTVDLEKVEAQLFELVSGSRRAEVVFLNQDLAVRSTSIFRDFDADFLGPLFYWLLHLIHQSRDRLRLVKFHDDPLDGIRTRTDPTCSSRPGASIQQMLDRVSRVLRRISDRRATGDVELIGSTGARRRIGSQQSLAKSR